MSDTQRDLEGTVLSEVRQSQRDKYHFSYLPDLKKQTKGTKQKREKRKTRLFNTQNTRAVARGEPGRGMRETEQGG